MRREILIVLLAGIALLVWTRAQALPDPGASDPADDLPAPPQSDPFTLYIPGTVNEASVNNPPPDATPEQNVAAFLALIRQFESGNDYTILYGGRHFSDFSEHPNVGIPINLPGYEGKHSTAAGAYQFIHSTWQRLASKLGLPDFTPASQDAAAVELLAEIGALSYVEQGDFDQAMRIASSQWASLPYSQAKQGPRSIVAANEFLRRYLASVA